MQDEVADKAKLYVDSCVPEMFGETIFDTMLDLEIKKLFPIPEVVVAVEAFRTKFNECVEVIGSQGLQNAKTRREEREMFFQALVSFLAAWSLTVRFNGMVFAAWPPTVHLYGMSEWEKRR